MDAAGLGAALSYLSSAAGARKKFQAVNVVRIVSKEGDFHSPWFIGHEWKEADRQEEMRR